MRLSGLGTTSVYPAQPGVSRDIASQACVVAGGQWSDGSINSLTLIPSGAGCILDTGNTLPKVCDSIPFASILFPDCAAPSSAQQIAAYGAYPIYVAAQNHPEIDGETDPGVQNLANQNQNNANNIAQNIDCDFLAQSNNPGLYLALGSSLTRMLTNPFNTNCTPPDGAIPGWVVYAGLGILAYALLRR